MNLLRRKKVMIPTYPTSAPEPLPIYFEKRPYQGASGSIYPIPYTPGLSDEKTEQEYDAIDLENEYVAVRFLPEIGGKLHSALDKTNGYDFVYHNKVIKPAMVGLAGPWCAGGIEFNFPQHHRPTTFLPAEAAVDEKSGKVFIGETDYFYGMKSLIEFSLGEESSVLRAQITVYNGTAQAHPFLWWANMAVEINDDYRIVFPPDVEYVNDHDRRAVLEWPIARGIYRTARPYDYGTGTDIHIFSAVKVPSSFMVARGQSDFDFVSGYDTLRKAGVVTVSDHRIAPGKKLWTWGDGEFGAKWCSNLTDDGSRYVELMTGCYTDNQPDFTWIAPYETKKFTQYWYPVRDIGEVKCATKEGACNLEQREKGLYVGYYSAVKRNCRLRLAAGGKTLFEKSAALSPEKTFSETVAAEVPLSETELSVWDERGALLLRYRPPKRGEKHAIEPRFPAKAPEELGSTEELWLNGLHLLQYKHFSYRAEDYFREGLVRDGGDLRCNEAMGDLCLARGLFRQAKEYYTAAIKRATLRNENPYDTAPYYKRALCAFRLGAEEDAERDAYAAIWSESMRTAGYYLLAKLAARRGNTGKAAELLEESLQTNTRHLWARYIRGLLVGDREIKEKISREDPFFFPDGSERRAVAFALELMDFGRNDEAMQVLSEGKDGALKFYHLAELCRLAGDEAGRKAYVDLGDAAPWEAEFPSLVESEAALKQAGTPIANYYLGCLYYHLERYDEACLAWEQTARETSFAPALRGLALGYFDHLGKKALARKCLEQARAQMPKSGRIFYELTQMYKSLNLPQEDRLALFRSEPVLTSGRDDCTLAYSVLLTEQGDYEQAAEVLNRHRFHTYEGGEGYLTQHHAWLYFLVGRDLMRRGEYDKAIEALENGLRFPLNYGEEKNYFVNDAPIYFSLAECYQKTGENEKRKNALSLAVSTKGSPTIHSYWQCLAHRERGEEMLAERLACQMKELGEEDVRHEERCEYFGVGAPCYPPFCYDVARVHHLQGTLLSAFGYLASDDRERAEKLRREAEQIDCADFGVFLLKYCGA